MERYDCDGQLSIFDCFGKKYTIPKEKEICLIELFCGYGSQALALRDMGVKFKSILACDIDKYAIKSYNAIHGTDYPVMDITKLKGADLGITDKTNKTYILTYSFPCQSLSVAGKMKGMKKGSGTRSGLLWEVERLLNETEELPQILLMENVPQVHSKKNMADFQSWLDFLNSKGYSTFWQDMNAADYGVAQSRNRTIAISILGDYTYSFPEPYPLDKCMDDYLEDDVEEKFYITSEKAWNLLDSLVKDGKIPTNERTNERTMPC